MAKKRKPKPETELKLDALQADFLETRSKEAWEEMFHLLIIYARSLLLKINKGKVYIPPEKVLAVATDAAMKVLEKYSDPTFKIQASFAGLLHWKVIESLYGKYKDEINISLNQTVGKRDDGDSNTELGDLQEKAGFSTFLSNQITPEESFPHEGEVIRTVSKLLDEFDEAVSSPKLSFLGRAYLLLTLRRSKVRFAATRFLRVADITPKEEKTLELLVLEFHNRAKDFALTSNH